MKIHHLNCATLNLRFAKILDGQRKVFDGSLSCVTHCILIETNNSGLVLVDSGFSIKDMESPEKLPFIFNFIFRPVWKKEETAFSRIKSLGFSPNDVRHIIFTHLHYDHANGLFDFPWAMAHCCELELKYALSAGSFYKKLIYDRKKLITHDKWETYDLKDGDSWYGLNNACPVRGLNDDFAIIPLMGHSPGHSGIAINAGEGWLLHAGDAYMTHGELQPLAAGQSHEGWFNYIMSYNHRLRNESLLRIKEFNQRPGKEINILCSHDSHEFEHFRQSAPVKSFYTGPEAASGSHT